MNKSFFQLISSEVMLLAKFYIEKKLMQPMPNYEKQSNCVARSVSLPHLPIRVVLSFLTSHSRSMQSVPETEIKSPRIRRIIGIG